MIKQDFTQQAINLAKETLYAYFVEHDNDKVLHNFSKNNTSWIGWAKHELYLNYRSLFNTLSARKKEIVASKINFLSEQSLYSTKNLYVIFIDCHISANTETGIYLSEYARYSFIITLEDFALKIVHLHSSTTWNMLKNNEYYPRLKGSTLFYKQEQNLAKQSLLSILAINSPNGLKCCKIDKNYPAIFINKYLYTLAGYTSMTEMLIDTQGKLDKLIYPSDLPKVKRAMATHTDGKNYTINYRLLRKNKTPIWVLERGHYFAKENEAYFFCAITPLDLDNENLFYGDLFDINSLENPELPIELYLKTILDITYTETNKQLALKRILNLCCSILQTTGVVLQNIITKDVLYSFTTASDNKQTPCFLLAFTQEHVSRYNTQNLNICNDTHILPTSDMNIALKENLYSYISKIINVNQKKSYNLTFYQLYKKHIWTENEQDLIEQTAKIIALLL